MVEIWKKASSNSLGIVAEGVRTKTLLPLANTVTNANISLISGKLPDGLNLNGNYIEGTPYEVARDEISQFVLRAVVNDNFEDRTYTITVVGPDSPEWITDSGRLPVYGNLFFILDNVPVDFQLEATDPDLPTGEVLEYYIEDGDGVLPPGLSLSLGGRITGTTEPLLALDNTIGSGNYDTVGYGQFPFDFGETVDPAPRKLNGIYKFTVSVTDRNTVVKRDFEIYLVGDDFLRADNNILKISDGIFTADNTYVRTPIWLTPPDLGYRRADNFITVYLDVLDSNTIEGKLKFELLSENNDGSVSQLPPGLTIDSTSGELFGLIPYQQTYSKDYKFTVRATRYIGDTNDGIVFVNIYEDTLLGKSNVKIDKLSRSLEDGIDDLGALVTRRINLEDNIYTISSVDSTNPLYDIVTLSTTLSPAFPIIVHETAMIGDSYIFVSTLSESNKNKLINKELRFTDIEVYKINDIIPYVTWNIFYSDNSNLIFDPNDLVTLDPDMQYSISDDRVLTLKIKSTAITRNISKIKEIFDPSNSSITVNASISNYYDKLVLNQSLNRRLVQGRNIGIGAFKDSNFTVDVTSQIRDTVTAPYKDRTFTLTILGEVDSTIRWLTDPYLGSIDTNTLSIFKVEATTDIVNPSLTYSLYDGVLPPGLSLSTRGEITGRVNQYAYDDILGLTYFDLGETIFDDDETVFDRLFTFTIEAKDRFVFSSSRREFSILVIDEDKTVYSNLYLKPLLKENQRALYENFISDTSIFPTEVLYSRGNPEFGIQRELKVLAYAGIESKSLEEYYNATFLNHKRRRYKFGDIKVAQAKKPGTVDTIYEVVYVDIIDPYEADEGKVAKSISLNNDSSVFYISNISNMRDNISEIGKTERNFLPLWMRTAQQGEIQATGFRLAFPICYCNPGFGNRILFNIRNSGFNFQNIDFEVDRYIIDRYKDVYNSQYIFFSDNENNI